LNIATYLLLGLAAIPFVYYAIVLYSSWRYFSQASLVGSNQPPFQPPVSNLKPIRGLDPQAYENFASFCRQDYADYEILFCVGDRHDPALPVIEQLARDFPHRQIRVLFGSGSSATNDKVAKLARLVREARHEVLVISDSDVLVEPDYLRTVVAPLADPHVGAATCLYVPTSDGTFAEKLQAMGMASDFYAGILVARQLDGVKFALGPTIATTRTRLAEFGGYEALQNRPADDLLVGRLIADGGHEVVLLPYTIAAVADYASVRELIDKRLRWMVVMRHLRPWGHLGLVFTQGIAWSLAAVALRPSLPVAAGYFGGYLLMRMAITWLIGVRGLRQRALWKRMPFVLLWDLLALAIWIASFARNTIRWRDGRYSIREGMLIPVRQPPGQAEETAMEP
jgi:ceramide glucosyltransferase